MQFLEQRGDGVGTADSQGPGDGSFVPPTPTETRSDGKPPVQVLATTSDVGVGGAVFIDSSNVPGEPVANGIVITQPAEGEFHAFSRDCTHAHCAVTNIVDGKLHCPCHGSRFDPHGRVVMGPAVDDLKPVE